VKSVETRPSRGAGGTDLILTLEQGADARSGVADGAVWLNLYAPGKAPEGVTVREHAGHRFVSGATDIGNYLAAAYGSGRPH
jgi:hypothetical protein